VPHIRERVGGSRGGVEGVGSGLRLTFRHNGTSCVPKEPSMDPKPTSPLEQTFSS